MFNVKIGKQTFQLENKQTILSLIPKDEQKKYYAAKVNNRLRELTYEVSFNCEIELLDLKNSDAVKVYETSLRYLIVMAIYRLQPEYSVRLSYNVSRSIFVQLLNKNQAFDSRFIKNVVSEMKKIVEADYPLTRRLITK
mgnify:FL=1